MKLSLSILSVLPLAMGLGIKHDQDPQMVSRNLESTKRTVPLAQNAPTLYATVNGTKIAYRRFGKKCDVPVIYFNHFRASMDMTDPLVFNYIAEEREVILFDNSGVGHSEGNVSTSVGAMGDVAVGLLSEIGVSKVDLFGFSLGGLIAQYIGLDYPELVQKIILSGTQPGNGTGVRFGDDSIYDTAGRAGQFGLEDMLFLFFEDSETSKEAGRNWWGRLQERNVKGETKTGFVDGSGIQTQLTAAFSFGYNGTWFDRLSEIKVPVLVTNGKDDVMIPTVNSFVLQQQLPYAYLELYPDSGHGHLFQFPEAYAASVNRFLAL